MTFFDFEEAWLRTVSKIVLEQNGINDPNNAKIPVISESQADGYVSRYPSLYKKDDFLVPVRRNPPFPIISVTLVAPRRDTPRPVDSDAYTQLEMTPLYIGQESTREVDYPKSRDWWCFWCGDDASMHDRQTIGGFIETIGFNTRAPAEGLMENQSNGTLVVEKPMVPFTLQRMLTASR